MVKALRSRRARRLLRDWESFLDSLDDQRPIGALAGARIRKVYGRMVRMGDAIDEDSPPQDYHELRKKGKELRYLLELFGVPLYALEVVAPMVKALKGLQDVLGRHQDREVQVAMLQGLRDEVVARPDGAAALMAMGALVARLEADERAARAAFAQRFAEFASKAQRRRVKETFA
jgi:CHAD domain-containing protein